MCEDGMNKYGVALDDEKVKESSVQYPDDKCFICGKELDSGGACPEHGTEPFEKKTE